MTTNIISTINADNICDVHNTHASQYLEDDNLYVHFYHGSVKIIDLVNALKRGADCDEFTVQGDFNNDSASKFFHEFQYDIKRLMSFLRALKFNKSRYGGNEGVNYGEVIIYKSSLKGIRVFSPFNLDQIKPLKSEPKKWTITHVIRALLNGQYKSLKCNGVYTDDYAYDAAMNYRKGEISDGQAFAQRILESPSGWWAYQQDESVSICCHSFDSNSFVPVFA